MDITFLQGLWFVLIAVLIAGYFVLDGFDLGVGVMYPFIAKNEKEKAIARRSIGPVWDGNEVWLLTAGGALFAAFPHVYATTFSGFYLAIMLVLFGLIARAVSIEFRSHDAKWRKLWDGCFFVGSLLPALLFGVAIGNVFAGIPMDAHGDYAGIPLLGLITPFTLLCGLLGLAMFLAQGLTWLSLKAPKPSELQSRAAKWCMPIQIVCLVLLVVVTGYAHVGAGPEMMPELAVLRVVFALLVLAAIILSMYFARKGSDKAAFLSQSVSAFSLVGVFAASMFPAFVVASANSVGPTITAMSGSASELSLFWMAIIVCIGLPLVLVYHFIIYRTFRGRIEETGIEEY
jgi:cytochrome d ubiquinol oxidase subunit II